MRLEEGPSDGSHTQQIHCEWAWAGFQLFLGLHSNGDHDGTWGLCVSLSIQTLCPTVLKILGSTQGAHRYPNKWQLGYGDIIPVCIYIFTVKSRWAPGHLLSIRFQVWKLAQVQRAGKDYDFSLGQFPCPQVPGHPSLVSSAEDSSAVRLPCPTPRRPSL